MKRELFLIYYVLIMFVLFSWAIGNLSRTEAILSWLLIDAQYILNKLYDK